MPPPEPTVLDRISAAGLPVDTLVDVRLVVSDVGGHASEAVTQVRTRANGEPAVTIERPAGGERLAGCSSLGVGGTNAHIVLSDAPMIAAPTSSTRSPRTECAATR